MKRTKLWVILEMTLLLRLKARELDLRAMDNEQKRMQAEQRLNLDKSRAMMNQDITRRKA